MNAINTRVVAISLSVIVFIATTVIATPSNQNAFIPKGDRLKSLHRVSKDFDADLSLWYLDSDSDGYGDENISIEDSIAPLHYVADHSDCNDQDAAINPGVTEICNGLDDNCNGETDEGALSSFYADSDSDGYGNPASSILACSVPAGFVANQDDCNDTNASIHPGTADLCNSIDDDCDGSTDEDATFITYYIDYDLDTFGSAASLPLSFCVNPGPGYSTNNLDCNDSSAAINPTVIETCNQIDDNCNGSIDEGVQQLFYADADHDGFGSTTSSMAACSQPAGYLTDHSDCDDNNPMVNPVATEICNGIDDDCSGIIDDHVSSGNLSIIWQKALGGTKGDVANAMDYTQDGGYIMAGSSISANGDATSNHGKNDFWVVKIDSSGNIIWQKSFGGTNDDIANAIVFTTDGGYAITGSTASGNGDVSGNRGGIDFWLIRLDGNGNLLWQKCFGGSDADIAYSIDQTTDGGFAIAGSTRSANGDVTNQHGNGDYWLVKTDANGALQWQKTYGGSGYDFAHALQQTSDGGYILSGYARSNDGDVALAYGQEDMWILKLDPNGNITWQKTYGGTGGEGANYLQQTSDGGYILTGITHSSNIDVVGNHGPTHDAWVVKIDANGNKQWAKCFGGSDTEEAQCIRQTSDGGYLVAALADSHDGDVTSNHGGHDYWVFKINSNGALQWQRSLGGSLDDEANAILETRGGKVLVAGFASSNDDDVSGNHGASDYWIAMCAAPVQNTFYQDADGDSYGNPAVSITACSAPAGYVSDATDCNDANASIHPNAFENCNGVDDDCDNYIDEDFITATISPLATVTICKTSVLTLQCNTDSLFTYQWKRNGNNIAGATNPSYSTSANGNYSVLITKGSCSANSPTTVVKLTNGNVSVIPKGTTTLCPKASIIYSVTEAPGIAYQWHSSTGIISGATTRSYATSKTGTYYVTETDITGCSFNSSSSTLKNYAAAIAQISVSGSLHICSTGSVVLNATVVAGQTYQWYKDNLAIAGATQTTYAATQAGSYKFLATTLNGCTAYSNSKNVTGCKTDESLSEDSNGKLSVYPNPSDGLFSMRLETGNSYSGTAHIRIYDLLGQNILARDAEVTDGSLFESITLKSVAGPGLYLLKLEVGGDDYVSPFVISK